MNEHVFSCDGAGLPSEWSRAPQRHYLGIQGEAAQVTDFQLELPGPILGSLDPRMRDLVRIASYCFLADESASRGGEKDVYLKDWRRQMRLAIAYSTLTSGTAKGCTGLLQRA